MNGPHTPERTPAGHPRHPTRPRQRITRSQKLIGGSRLRTPSETNPPSLFQGDDVVLSTIRDYTDDLMSGTRAPRREGKDHALSLFLTGTDLYGYQRLFSDSTGRVFADRDHRVVFAFTHEPGDEVSTGAKTKRQAVGRSKRKFVDKDAAVARAARSSASFPFALEPHRFDRDQATPADSRRWLIDGGALDNQPFNPLLDHIGVFPAKIPVRRVVAYVVPYVTEPGVAPAQPGAATPTGTKRNDAELDDSGPTALQAAVAGASLARGLPRLQGLERIRRDWQTQHEAEHARQRIALFDGEALVTTAGELFKTYRVTRHGAAVRTFRAWASSAQSGPTSDAVSAERSYEPDLAIAPILIPDDRRIEDPRDVPWIPNECDWSSRFHWKWGLAASERVAAAALAALRGPMKRLQHCDRDYPSSWKALERARHVTSELIWDIRCARSSLRDAMCESSRNGEAKIADDLLISHARKAYKDSKLNTRQLFFRFSKLETELHHVRSSLTAEGCQPEARIPDVQTLLFREIVTNAFTSSPSTTPVPFVFLHASAGVRNSLGHEKSSPETKLAGMGLAHFQGFLKRSWRANDWLWGRLDGVEHVLRACVDLKHVVVLLDAEEGLDKKEEGLDKKLLDFASPNDDAEATYEALERACELRRSDNNSGNSADHIRANIYWDCCRAALAARIQLAFLSEELDQVAHAVDLDLKEGFAKAGHAVDWERAYRRDKNASRNDGKSESRLTRAELVTHFRELKLGGESVADEAASRAGMSIAAQVMAVASATVTGNRSGLPLAVRSPLSGLRGGTLAASSIVRLLATTPAFGIAILLVLLGLIVWGFSDQAGLIGTLLPISVALAILASGVLVTTSISALAGSLRDWRRGLGLTALVALPLAFGLIWTVAPTEWGRDWLVGHIGEVALAISGSIAFVSAGSALTRFGLAALSRRGRSRRGFIAKWRSSLVLRSLKLYRWTALAVLGAAGGGFIAKRLSSEVSCDVDPSLWNCAAAEQRGAIMLLALITAFATAALFVDARVAAGRAVTAARVGAGRAVTALARKLDRHGS